MFLLDDLLIASLMSAAAPTAAATVGPTLASAAALGGGTLGAGAIGAGAGALGASAIPMGAIDALSTTGMLSNAVSGAAGAAQPSGFMGALGQLAPNVTGMGQNLAQGNIQGAAGNLGGLVGGDNLKSFINSPSYASAGNMAKGAGDSMVQNSLAQSVMGSGPGQVKPVQPARTSGAKVPQVSDNPIVQRMYQNLNQQQQQPMPMEGQSIQPTPFMASGPGFRNNKLTPGL